MAVVPRFLRRSTVNTKLTDVEGREILALSAPRNPCIEVVVLQLDGLPLAKEAAGFPEKLLLLSSGPATKTPSEKFWWAVCEKSRYFGNAMFLLNVGER